MKDRAHILVVNCGSSSVKIELFQIAENSATDPLFIASGNAERLNSEKASCKIDSGEASAENSPQPGLNVEKAIRFIFSEFEKKNLFQANSLLAIGHRVVHGGTELTAPKILNDEEILIIKRNTKFAPLHNPANLLGISVCKSLYPEVTNVAVFDTGFHQTMPASAYTYAIPGDLSRKYGIRRFGFHGISHQYMLRETARFLSRKEQEVSLISIHLGNGASVCAIQNGKSIDTSMGFTPLEGLVMGTRCGDIDPAISLFLLQNESMSVSELDSLLNKNSGLNALAGTNDMRDILERAASKEDAAILARDIFCYRVKKYVGSYLAAIRKPDAIVFTAGIGENSSEIRALVLQNLEHLGIEFDQSLNTEKNSATREISAANSRIKVLVIPTDEEKMIAIQTRNLLGFTH